MRDTIHIGKEETAYSRTDLAHFNIPHTQSDKGTHIEQENLGRYLDLIFSEAYAKRTRNEYLPVTEVLIIN